MYLAGHEARLAAHAGATHGPRTTAGQLAHHNLGLVPRETCAKIRQALYITLLITQLYYISSIFNGCAVSCAIQVETVLEARVVLDGAGRLRRCVTVRTTFVPYRALVSAYT